jgi:hypothetical protein
MSMALNVAVPFTASTARLAERAPDGKQHMVGLLAPKGAQDELLTALSCSRARVTVPLKVPTAEPPPAGKYVLEYTLMDGCTGNVSKLASSWRGCAMKNSPPWEQFALASWTAKVPAAQMMHAVRPVAASVD